MSYTIDTEAGCDGDGAANLRAGNLAITVDYADTRTPDGRQSYRWAVTILGPDGGSWTDTDLNGPACGADPMPSEMLGTLLSFLSAALESRSYRERTGGGGENEDLFPADMLDACDAYRDTLDTARFELEDAEDEDAEDETQSCDVIGTDEDPFEA
jgi:hypothetical protein